VCFFSSIRANILVNHCKRFLMTGQSAIQPLVIAVAETAETAVRRRQKKGKLLQGRLEQSVGNRKVICDAAAACT
jgi:hypothetical protein